MTMHRTPRLFVRMFMPRFAPPVQEGDKLQTVRPAPKRMPEAGDRISLRTWTGKPYRSKQRILGEGTITKVERIFIHPAGEIFIDEMRLTIAARLAFAVADGFGYAGEFIEWFREQPGLPFKGIVIHWELHKES